MITMTERKQAIEMCLQFQNVYEDYPFGDFNWALFRHCDNKKTFALVYDHKGKTCLNLKAIPELGAIWRQEYSAVTEGYHMNKLHWITVVLDGTLPDNIIFGLITDSYQLTLPRAKNTAKR